MIVTKPPLCTGGHVAPISKRHLACSVSLQEDTPVLEVVESCPAGQHGDMLLRSYAVHSVDDEAALEGSQRSSSGGHSLSAKKNKICLIKAQRCLCSPYLAALLVLSALVHTAMAGGRSQ